MLQSVMLEAGVRPNTDFSEQENHYREHIAELAASTQQAIVLALANGVDYVACADPTLDEIMPGGEIGLRIAGGVAALSNEELVGLASKAGGSLTVYGHKACGFIFSAGAVTAEEQQAINVGLEERINQLNNQYGMQMIFGVQEGGSAPLRK